MGREASPAPLVEAGASSPPDGGVEKRCRLDGSPLDPLRQQLRRCHLPLKGRNGTQSVAAESETRTSPLTNRGSRLRGRNQSEQGLP